MAKQYVITDAGWNLLDSASQMRSLTSGNLGFRTLPIKGFATIDGQDANVVSVPAIEAIVHAVFFPKPVPRQARPHPAAPVKPSAAATTVDVLNGGPTTGLAARISAVLVKAGDRAGTVGNTPSRTATSVSYGPGASANAAALARMFGVTAAPAPSLAAGQIRILLGARAVLPGALAASQPQPACDDRSHRRAAGRCGDRPQGRYSLRELTGGQAGPPDSGVRSSASLDRLLPMRQQEMAGGWPGRWRAGLIMAG